MYTISLNEREQHTADWLSDRGYLGNFFDVAKLTLVPEENNGEWQYTLTEPAAWEFHDSIMDAESGELDEAFLSCNGSRTLASKLFSLIESII